MHAATQPLVISYLGIRRAVGIIGLLLPPTLLLGGWLLGVPIQDDMSSYYHTPLRDVFVGSLCAIGVFLLCYRGHDRTEDWTANFACVSALALAFFPLDFASQPPVQRTIAGHLHTLAGAIFFMTLAVYSLRHFPRPSDDDPPDRLTRQRNLVYRVSGLIILGSMPAMGAYLFLIPPHWREIADRFNALFWLEWTAVWSFASAWLTKGRVIGADLAIALLAVAESTLPERLRPSGLPIVGEREQ